MEPSLGGGARFRGARERGSASALGESEPLPVLIHELSSRLEADRRSDGSSFVRLEVPAAPYGLDVPVEWTDLHPGPELRPTAATPLLSVPALLACAAQVECLQRARRAPEPRPEEV